MYKVEELSASLATGGDLDAVLQRSADTLVPELADLSVVALGDTAAIDRLAVAHRRPVKGTQAREQLESSLPTLLRAALSEVEEGHYFRWTPDVRQVDSRVLSRPDREVAGLMDRLGVQSLIVVALRVGGRSIGALGLARTESERPYRAIDLATAQVIARRIALAVEEARLREVIPDPAAENSRVGEALRKWIQVFDLAWWGAALVDGTDQRIETANPSFARLHGFADPDALTGRPFGDLVPPSRLHELKAWPSGPGAQAHAYESEHIREDGTRFPVLVNVTPMEGEGTSGAYVVTVQDLSDLKRTEERLRRAQRMEAVGRLAGGVAHEVNNMMTIIMGFGDLLARAPELNAERKREVDEVLKAAVRAGKITTQLLAFSRQQVLHVTDLQLNSLVQEIVPVLRLMLPANVRVETTVSDRDAVVHADRTQLEQVLINLAFNARDAMPEGGVIRLVTESRRLDAATGLRLIGIPIPEGQYGLVSVVDTGLGMDAATVARVFEPFFTTKPIGLGTGLGLATVYGIVKQSGGYVWVESTPNAGTTFTISLPEAPYPVEIEPAALLARGGGGDGERGTVLVIEDEDGVRELAARILTDRGHRVLQARNGDEALAALDQGLAAVDLVVTDVIVPDMGTDRLAQELYLRHPTVPILYMSGYPRDDIVLRGLLRPDQPFLQKPFTGEELAYAVGRYLTPP